MSLRSVISMFSAFSLGQCVHQASALRDAEFLMRSKPLRQSLWVANLKTETIKDNSTVYQKKAGDDAKAPEPDGTQDNGVPHMPHNKNRGDGKAPRPETTKVNGTPDNHDGTKAPKENSSDVPGNNFMSKMLDGVTRHFGSRNRAQSTNNQTDKTAKQSIAEVIKKQGLTENTNTKYDSLITLQALTVALGLAFSIFIIFGNLRKIVPKVYSPLRLDTAVGSSNCMSWLGDTIGASDEEVLDSAGLDGLSFLRFLQLVRNIFGLATSWGALLMMCHWQGRVFSSKVPLAKLGIGNLVGKDAEGNSDQIWLWGDVLSVCIMSLIVLYLIDRFDLEYLSHRLQYYRTCAARSTVLVQGIPDKCEDMKDGSLTSEALRHFFENIHPGRVDSVVIVKDRKSMAEQLYGYSSQAVQGVRKFAQIPLGLCKQAEDGAAASSIDSVGSSSSNEPPNACPNDESSAPPTKSGQCGFVTFIAPRDAHIAAQLQYGRSLDRWRIRLAPEPDEISWGNLTNENHYLSKFTRAVLAQVATVMLFIFWITPVIFVGSIANLGAWECQSDGKAGTAHTPTCFSFISTMHSNYPALYSFIEGILATATLKVFMAFLPALLDMLARFEGLVAERDVQHRVQHEYFLFQVIFVLLLASLANGVMSVLQQLLDRPGTIVTLLSNSVPKVSNYYINFIILAFGLVFFDLIQPYKLLQYYTIRWSSLSQAQSDEYAKSFCVPAEPFGWRCARCALYACIGFLYSTIAPLILPIVLLTFCAAIVVYKYKMLYMEQQGWDGGGLHWHTSVEHLMIGLLIYQVTMLGYFTYVWQFSSKGGTSEASWHVILLLPWPLVTLCYHLYRRSRFYHRFLPLEDEDAIDLPNAKPKAKYIQPLPDYPDPKDSSV